MKRLFTIMTAVLLSASVFAQSPQKMSYQAVIRNSLDQLITNHAVGMRISILQGSSTGTPVYVETQNATTNANGLVTIEIGGGTIVTGTFAGIDWSAGPYFIKTETDPSGGTTYTITGTSPLLSVPYALHAKTVASYPETDPIFGVWNKSAGINITASQVSDFTTSVTNNTAVLTNTAKNSYPTADAAKLAAITGTNTGDETTATIKTKLAITTLSGSNTGDQDLSGLATTTDLTGGLSTKVDKVTGKGLSTNDYTTVEQTKLAAITGINTGDETTSTIKTKLSITTLSGSNTGDQDLSGKVDKVTGKDLAPNGTVAGQMQYWNGAAWITVAPGTTGQVLTFISGVPTWKPTIWATDVINPTTGKIWMDRNLGATQVATSSTDAASYGYLYQWGRGTDGHQIRTSGTTSTLSSTDAPGHANFILAPSDPYDWRSPQNTNLWQGVSGINNPCPAGYRIPTYTELDAERLSWSSNNAAGAFASPLKLPVAGLHASYNGSLLDVGNGGHYWSSTVDGTLSPHLLFVSLNAYSGSSYRAYGFSVRCIKN